MHRSRLRSVVIDVDDLDAGVRFWTGALGVSERFRWKGYVVLEDPQPGLNVILQPVSEPKTSKSRIHLDFETDRLEAEVTRLEALGARRVDYIDHWWVMQDPCGNEFCVAPVMDSGFGGETHEWEGLPDDSRAP